MCWTVPGDEDFRQALDEMCMGLNELSERGAAIEVTFYDTDFDEEEGDPEEESRDDFLMLFVGPNPAAIMQVQRDLLVEDVVNLMERHFDGAELGGVVAEIDQPLQRPLRRAGELARNRQAPARHRWPGQRRQRWWPWRRSPSASPALGNPTPRSKAAWPCFPPPRCARAFASARCSAGRCTTSPTRATPRSSSQPCSLPTSWAALPRARRGPPSRGQRRSAPPTRS